MICGHSLAKCRGPLVNFYFPLVPFFHSSRFFKLKTITCCLKVSLFPNWILFSFIEADYFLSFLCFERWDKVTSLFWINRALNYFGSRFFVVNEFLRYSSRWHDITSLNNCRSIVVHWTIKASKTNEFCFRLNRRSLIKRWSMVKERWLATSKLIILAAGHKLHYPCVIPVNCTETIRKYWIREICFGSGAWNQRGRAIASSRMLAPMTNRQVLNANHGDSWLNGPVACFKEDIPETGNG